MKDNESSENIVRTLKDLIGKNGPDYLTREPYAAYKELIAAKADDKLTLAAVLYALVRGVEDMAKGCGSKEELSAEIRKECLLEKEMADRLSGIFHAVYSAENRAYWEEKKLEGWQEFRRREFKAEWEGASTWDNGSVYVDCTFEAEILLKPDEDIAPDPGLSRELEKNQFLSADAISGYYESALQKYLDREFDHYCTCEEYYSPIAEDFEIDSYVEDWCRKNGFTLIEVSGQASTGDYEPRHSRRWY